MSRQTPSLPRASVPCPCYRPPEQPIYDLVFAALPLLRRLESDDCAALAAHVDAGGLTVQVPRRPRTVDAYSYVEPPRGMPQAPVRCRAVVAEYRGCALAVEWTVEPVRRVA